MDALADVLSATRIRNTVLCRAEFLDPWGLEFAPANKVHFHIVGRGTCWLRVPEFAPVQLVQGDVALVPFGGGHILSGLPDSSPLPVDRALASRTVRADTPSELARASTLVACGGYTFEQDGRHPLLSQLPRLIHIPADEAESAGSLRVTIGLLMKEMSERQPGSDTVVSRLLDTLFVLIVRAWLVKAPYRSAGWLGALGDPQVGAAISMIHAAPDERWSVEKLAMAVSMSRAAFARRFAELVGEPPLTYVTRWRMDVAARLLRDSRYSLASIAHRVGYEAESSFSKAFTRARGLPPGRYRTERRRSAKLVEE